MRRFMLKDDILYYISQVDDEPKLRIFIPKHLKEKIINQYQNENGHMCTEKTFLSIKEIFYWPRLYPELYEVINSCIICKKRNLIQQKSAVQTTKMPPYPMAVLQLDLSGPYRKTLSGNLYIATFICLYSGWIEAFCLPDKSSQSVLECFIEYILPSHSCCLAIQTDNGSEFTNQAFQETLNRFNIKHITSSIYSPRSQGMVERSHRCLHDLLSKLMSDHSSSWDLFLNSALFAIRTNVSKTTLMSPFKILYNRDPVLPIDNLLMPREKTFSDNYHDLAFENVHRIFVNVKKNMKRAKEKRNEIANRNRKPTSFTVGDPVFYKNFTKTSKLDKKWLTHYNIIEQSGPVSFKIRNQLTGATKRVHADALRLANVTWKMPKQHTKTIRKTRLVTSSPDSSSDTSDNEASGSDELNAPNNESDFDSDSTIIYDPKQWLERGVNRERKLRENSSSEDDIPEFELRKKN